MSNSAQTDVPKEKASFQVIKSSSRLASSSLRPSSWTRLAPSSSSLTSTNLPILLKCFVLQWRNFNLILQLLDELFSLLILVLKVSSSNSSIQNRESQRLVREDFRKKLVHHLVCDTLLLMLMSKKDPSLNGGYWIRNIAFMTYANLLKYSLGHSHDVGGCVS